MPHARSRTPRPEAPRLGRRSRNSAAGRAAARETAVADPVPEEDDDLAPGPVVTTGAASPELPNTAAQDHAAAAVTWEAGPFPMLVPPTLGGQRLDKVLVALVPGFSRARLQALIQAGELSDADGQVLREPAFPVPAGARLILTLPPPVAAAPQPQPIPLAVVYEDASVIVVDKPVGLVVHPAPGAVDGTLVNALLHHCGASLSGIGGVRRPGIVHRIDKDTSGLLVVAKTDRAHQGLAAQFAAHTVERAYAAVVWGCPSPRVGTIDAPVGRDPRDRLRMAVVAEGRRAVTHYAVERPLGLGASLVDCRLETGRTHQVRLHMAHLGHGLFGDALYARPTRAQRQTLADGPRGVAARTQAEAFPRQALHARLLGFEHPVSGRHHRFESPLPQDLERLIAGLTAKG